MIRSMTAFARHETAMPWGQITWEIRSVNHRYLEPLLKLPDNFRSIEPQLRDTLRKNVKRGKIDCQMRYQLIAGSETTLSLNQPLLEQLLAAVKKIDQQLDKPAATQAMDVLRWPGVMQESSVDLEEMQAVALQGFQQAIAELIESREREGSSLKALIEQRLDGITAITEQVKSLLPELRQQQRQKLLDKLAEAEVDAEDSRVEQEIVLLAQKMDVDEELDRLITHVKEVRRVLNKGGDCGRRLDFLMQELNREANTLSSKSTTSSNTQSAVELKVLIEQMREQIQNIE